MPSASAALLVVDMLNPYDHEDAGALAGHAATVVEPLADLIARAREDDEFALIYVNDNLGPGRAAAAWLAERFGDPLPAALAPADARVGIGP